MRWLSPFGWYRREPLRNPADRPNIGATPEARITDHTGSDTPRAAELPKLRNRVERSQPVMRETDPCLTIPIRLAAIVSLWVLGVLLGALYSIHQVRGAGIWAICAWVTAATLTFVHVLTRHHRLIRQAFELGVETGKRDLSAVR